MTLSNKPRAVVLLSGGLDSATCLAIAQQTYDCYALSFAYGQRHNSELAAASRLAIALNAKEHRIINIDLGGIGG
ncbi:MAG TPA: 7-cyano-7-deazaguanine synthase, partial [Agitococcus sp.]|nr:7-cyano-7-deazaguanine synthase [Agitococcus sp.]